MNLKNLQNKLNLFTLNFVKWSFYTTAVLTMLAMYATVYAPSLKHLFALVWCSAWFFALRRARHELSFMLNTEDV